MCIIHHGQTNCILDKTIVGQERRSCPNIPARGGECVEMRPICPGVHGFPLPHGSQSSMTSFSSETRGADNVSNLRLPLRIYFDKFFELKIFRPKPRILTWKSPIFGCGWWKFGEQNSSSLSNHYFIGWHSNVDWSRMRGGQKLLIIRGR